MIHPQRKAVALISGGLDSMLAAKLVLEQGIWVEGLNFFTGFCVEGHTHAIRHRPGQKPKRNNALWVAEQLGIRLHLVDVIEEYKDVVLNPKHGYGANLNPCIDCKSFMVAQAREWMTRNGFDFIITGEVLGQRPKSQRRDTFPIIARESGACDRLLRPLSAKLLPPTLPEAEGWVERSKLCGFSGRGRGPQIGLAAGFGFTDYAQPAGGCCFLTDRAYARKLRDLWEVRGEKSYDFDDVMLLKIGRHLRPSPRFKLIIARDQGETRYLGGYRQRFVHMWPTRHGGPLTLVQGEVSDPDLELAARITARFCKSRRAAQVRIEVVTPERGSYAMSVAPLSADEIPGKWYL